MYNLLYCAGSVSKFQLSRTKTVAVVWKHWTFLASILYIYRLSTWHQCEPIKFRCLLSRAVFNCTCTNAALETVFTREKAPMNYSFVNKDNRIRWPRSGWLLNFPKTTCWKSCSPSGIQEVGLSKSLVHPIVVKEFLWHLKPLVVIGLLSKTFCRFRSLMVIQP